MAEQELSDKIGLAAIKARAENFPNPEYVISDNVDQMVLLYEILQELRKLNQ